MTWTLHLQNADHRNYRQVGKYKNKSSAKRRMLGMIDSRNEYFVAKGKGKMREEYDVHSSWSDAKRREFWMTEDIV